MKQLFTKRERIILYTTIYVVVFAIGFNLLIIPVWKKNDELNKEINITRAKLNKYTRLLNQKEYIQNKYNKFSSKTNLSGADKDTMVTVLSELENFAKGADIQIIDVRPEIYRDIDSHKEIHIDLRTEGTIENYLKFIYDIENSLSLLRIKELQLNAKSNTDVLEGSFFISQLSFSD